MIALSSLSALVGFGRMEPVAARPPQPSPWQLAAAPVPSDWQRLQGEGVAIALPSHFLGGNPQTELEVIAAQLATAIPDAEQRLTSIRGNLESFALVAFDSQLDETGFLTNLNIATDTVPTDLTTEELLAATAEALAEQSEIVASELVEVNAETSGRLLTRSLVANVQQLFYLFVQNGRLYVVVYSASRDAFEQQLPIFEQSIQTFEF